MNAAAPIILSRRLFLRGLVSVPIAVGLPLARLVDPLPREPFVRVGQVVDYVGLNLHPMPTFIGGELVAEIGGWDGSAYPCKLVLNTRPLTASVLVFPDHDLCTFHLETPARFWSSLENNRRYPNLHAFVRERRFGEDPAVMRARMDAVRFDLPWLYRDRPA